MSSACACSDILSDACSQHWWADAVLQWQGSPTSERKMNTLRDKTLGHWQLLVLQTSGGAAPARTLRMRAGKPADEAGHQDLSDRSRLSKHGGILRIVQLLQACCRTRCSEGHVLPSAELHKQLRLFLLQWICGMDDVD